MRHLRLRQVLNAQGFTGKEYREAIAFEKRNWKEDNMSLPTVGQVRKMHSTLGTWDSSLEWNSVFFMDGSVWNNSGGIQPKANYKYRLKRAQWKEQEQRTIEFFESMGV